MKKLLAILLCSVVLFSGCKKDEPHWSYKECLKEIETYSWIKYTYDYEVKEIKHDETVVGDDEVHCFDITITSNNKTKRYCCYAVLSDGEVMYVDIDWWRD